MTEWDMDNFIGRAMAERGLFYNWIDIGFGPRGARSLATSDTQLRAGELMRLDLGGRYKGYPCDMARSLAVGGRVNAQAQRAHEVILETNRRLREALRPGVTGRELYRLCMASIEDGGYISLTRQEHSRPDLGLRQETERLIMRASPCRLDPGATAVATAGGDAKTDLEPAPGLVLASRASVLLGYYA